MIEYARILTKSSEGLPTIPPSASHDNGDWSSNDIYENELYMDSLTGNLYTRSADTIVLLSSAGSSAVSHDTSLTGDGSVGSPLGVAIDPSADNLVEVTADGVLVNPTKWLEIEVLNGLSDPLPKMSVCYFKTSSSSADTPEVLLADNSSEATSSKTMGILKDTIAPGERGKLILVGEYDKFDTSAYSVGDRLWLGTFGGIVTTPPTAPEHAVFLGVVSRSQGVNGRICVSIQNGYELEELHNVTSDDYTTPQDEDSVLTFDSTQELWKRLTLFNLYTYVKYYFDSLYQAVLVSGTNIKTINGSSVLGSGNLVVSGGGASGVHTPLNFNAFLSNFATSAAVNGTSIGNFSMVANQLIAYPYIPRFSFTATGFYLNVPVGVAGNLGRILVYEDNNGVPTTKIFESANLDLSTNGVKTAATTFNFVAGTTYWLAFHCNAVPSGSIGGISVANAINIAFLTITPITALNRITTFGTSSPSPMNPTQGVNSILPFIGITKA